MSGYRRQRQRLCHNYDILIIAHNIYPLNVLLKQIRLNRNLILSSEDEKILHGKFGVQAGHQPDGLYLLSSGVYC